MTSVGKGAGVMMDGPVVAWGEWWRRERTGRLVVGGGGVVARRVRDDADGWLLGVVADVCERDARGWT